LADEIGELYRSSDVRLRDFDGDPYNLGQLVLLKPNVVIFLVYHT